MVPILNIDNQTLEQVQYRYNTRINQSVLNNATSLDPSSNKVKKQVA